MINLTMISDENLGFFFFGGGGWGGANTCIGHQSELEKLKLIKFKPWFPFFFFVVKQIGRA